MKEKTKFKRNCTECDDIMLYSTKGNYVKAEVNNYLCGKCKNNIVWKKKCNGCNKELFYSRKSNLTYSIKNNSLCSKCRNLITSSCRIGKTREEIYGKEKTQEMNRKFRKTRKGKPIHSDEHKEYLKHNSIFATLEGKERYNKIYKKRLGGIDYDEYIQNQSELVKYRNKVRYITEKQPIELLENYEKRGVAGYVGAYHLDHIYPISKGFENNISPEIIGDISNLQFITWEENLKKQDKIING